MSDIESVSPDGRGAGCKPVVARQEGSIPSTGMQPKLPTCTCDSAMMSGKEWHSAGCPRYAPYYRELSLPAFQTCAKCLRSLPRDEFEQDYSACSTCLRLQPKLPACGRCGTAGDHVPGDLICDRRRSESSFEPCAVYKPDGTYVGNDTWEHRISDGACPVVNGSNDSEIVVCNGGPFNGESHVVPAGALLYLPLKHPESPKGAGVTPADVIARLNEELSHSDYYARRLIVERDDARDAVGKYQAALNDLLQREMDAHAQTLGYLRALILRYVNADHNCSVVGIDECVACGAELYAWSETENA